MQHRVAWENAIGPIPPMMTIDHKCKMKLCRNVAHMEVVTQSVNSARKGHLSDDDVRAIRLAYASGESQGTLAKKYEVGQGHISQLVNGLLRKETI